MGTPGKIKRPLPPLTPTPGATPQIAPIPATTTTPPSDREIRDALAKIKTPEAKAFLAAIDALGIPLRFEDKLGAALAAVIMLPQLDGRLHMALVRLGAEAFVFDIHFDNITKPRFGFIDTLDHVEEAANRPAFLRFVVRRLLELSSASMDEDMRRAQLDRTIEMFLFVEGELTNSRGFLPQDEYLAYQTLLFQLIQKDYELLRGQLLDAKRGTAYKRALTKLEDHWKATTAVDLKFAQPANVPTYNIEKLAFRDYFNPSRKVEFPFTFFSSGGPTGVTQAPQIEIKDVIKKRYEQLVRLDDVKPGMHSPGGSGFPEPPALFDNASWQRWVRAMWDSALRMQPTRDAFDAILTYVARYFHAFTVHVPYDLEEGRRVKSYLTRTIPRAITGGLVHDCLVYATRWLFILGRLLAPGSRPSRLGKPRIMLVEMPAHMGVGIYIPFPLNRHVIYAFNNEDFKATEVHLQPDDPPPTDEEIARAVVAGVFSSIETWVLRHPLKSDISNAASLWREISTIASSKLTLPFPSSTEPHMFYLHFLSANARLVKSLNTALNKLYAPVRAADKIEAAGKREAALVKALAAYADAAPAEFEKAAADDKANVQPIRDQIQQALAEGEKKRPKKAQKVAIASPGWVAIGQKYVEDVQAAMKTLDLDKIDPDSAFRGDGFPLEVR